MPSRSFPRLRRGAVVAALGFALALGAAGSAHAVPILAAQAGGIAMASGNGDFMITNIALAGRGGRMRAASLQLTATNDGIFLSGRTRGGGGGWALITYTLVGQAVDIISKSLTVAGSRRSLATTSIEDGTGGALASLAAVRKRGRSTASASVAPNGTIEVTQFVRVRPGAGGRARVLSSFGSVPVSVPEPGTWALFAMGGLGLVFAGRRRTA